MPVSIRRSLLTNLVAGIIVFGGAVLLTTGSGSRRAVRTILKSVVERTIDHADSRLRGFFDPVTNELLLLRAWAQAGMIDSSDPDAMNRMLEPLIRGHPQVSSVIVADERGHEHMLLRIGDTWTSRQTRRDEWGAATRWRRWTDSEPEPVLTTRELDYDPRRRPWFIGANAARAAGEDDVHWTKPYTFATTKDPGITASIAFDGPDGLTWTMGFDILLNDISAFTDQIMIGHEGLAFVVSDDIKFVGLPRGEFWPSEGARHDALLRSPSEVNVQLIADAAAAMNESALQTEPRRFESDGNAWWGHTEPFRLGPGHQLWVAVAIPEADLLGSIATQRLWIIGITLGVLAFAVLRSVLLARRFSRPIEALVSQADRIGRGDLSPAAPVESNVSEVRRLAEAQERMRGALGSLMKLERDLQLARQIQQSTFPNQLPKLEGYAISAWSESAEETGGDTYDVIGYAIDGDATAGDVDANGDPQVRLTPDVAPRALLLLADATGHGIGPALSVAQVRAMLRMAVRMHGGLARITKLMNDELCIDLPEGRFITAWLGDLDTERHELRCFSAGQGPILHYRVDDDAFDVRGADTLPLGIVPNLDVAVPEPVVLARGDLFAVISDGVFEASNRQGDQFGAERVQEVIRMHRRETPGAILTALRGAVATFAGGAAADDDRTGILLKRT